MGKVIRASEVKRIMHESNKRITKDAIEVLEARIRVLLLSAISTSGNFSTVTHTEIEHAEG